MEVIATRLETLNVITGNETSTLTPILVRDPALQSHGTVEITVDHPFHQAVEEVHHLLLATLEGTEERAEVVVVVVVAASVLGKSPRGLYLVEVNGKAIETLEHPAL